MNLIKLFVILSFFHTSIVFAQKADASWEKLNEETYRDAVSVKSFEMMKKKVDEYIKITTAFIEKIEPEKNLKQDQEDFKAFASSFIIYTKGDCAWRTQINSSLKSNPASAFNDCVIARVKKEIEFFKNTAANLSQFKALTDAKEIIMPQTLK